MTKMTVFILRACLLTLVLSGSATRAAGPLTSARVASGRVAGDLTADGKVAGFRGIPYAAPPVGTLRWRSPARVSAWSGTLHTDHFAADCPSARPAMDSTVTAQSEDCLYLNVWTPARRRAAKLPVMVWIYGSAFEAGSSSSARFDGARLAARGVVLVSMNFRGGVLGYLTHPLLSAESARGVSGNYGLQDVLAALEWVQHNIDSFGGDPRLVTLFGQSSGSETVNILTASPLAKGLIQRAIGESGGSFGQRQPRTMAQSEADGVAFAARLGASTLDAMRAFTPEQLFAGRPPRFEPVIDGWLIPVDSYRAYRGGRQNDVPTLVGSNADESQLSTTLTIAGYQTQIQERFGAHAAAVQQRYPAADDAGARAASKTLGTLLLGDFNTTSWARLAAGSGKSAVFQYRFTRVPPPPAGGAGRGAYHGAEITYVFDNLSLDPRPWTPADQSLSRTLSTYWINFARSGDPNGSGLPHWPSLQREPNTIMEFGDQIHTVARPHPDDIDFLTSVFYGPNGLYSN